MAPQYLSKTKQVLRHFSNLSSDCGTFQVLFPLVFLLSVIQCWGILVHLARWNSLICLVTLEKTNTTYDAEKHLLWENGAALKYSYPLNWLCYNGKLDCILLIYIHLHSFVHIFLSIDMFGFHWIKGSSSFFLPLLLSTDLFSHLPLHLFGLWKAWCGVFVTWNFVLY